MTKDKELEELSNRINDLREMLILTNKRIDVVHSLCNNLNEQTNCIMQLLDPTYKPPQKSNSTKIDTFADTIDNILKIKH